MGKAGLVLRPASAQYALTERGRDVLAEHTDRIDMSVLAGFPEYKVFRFASPKASKDEQPVETKHADELSPSEAVGRLL